MSGALFRYTKERRTCWISLGEAGPIIWSCLALTLKEVTDREVPATVTVSRQSKMHLDNLSGGELGEKLVPTRLPRKLRSNSFVTARAPRINTTSGVLEEGPSTLNDKGRSGRRDTFKV